MGNSKDPPAPESEGGPLKGKLPDYDEVEVQPRNWLRSGGWVESPAQMLMTALATRRFGRLSLEAGLGTERPTKALVFPDESNRFLCFIPVADHPQALDVHDNQGRFAINLIKVLTLLKRVVPKGRKEFYSLSYSTSRIQVGDLEGMALVMPLKKEKGGVVKTKEQKAKAKARKSRKTGGDSTTPPAAAN